MKIPLKSIRDQSPQRPDGYYDDVVSRGVIDGDILILDAKIYNDLCNKYRPRLPGLMDLFANFGDSVLKWTKAGFPVASETRFKERVKTCNECPNWKDNRCMVCGCYQVKLWLDTEKCPENRWE